jgi:hypothetical protein
LETYLRAEHSIISPSKGKHDSSFDIMVFILFDVLEATVVSPPPRRRTKREKGKSEGNYVEKDNEHIKH